MLQKSSEHPDLEAMKKELREDEEFQFFLQKARATRELWWVPYEEIAMMNSKELSAFRIVAAEFEAKHYEALARISGDEMLHALMKEKEDGGVALGHLLNQIMLRAYKEAQ